MCIKGNCLWRELITVPDTSKCWVINSSLTLMLKWVSCLEGGANPLMVTTVAAFSSFHPGYRATGLQPMVRCPVEIPWHEHRGKNSHKIRSPRVPGLLLPSSEAHARVRGKRQG